MSAISDVVPNLLHYFKLRLLHFMISFFQVFEVASSDLINMGITVVSYTLKDIRDEEVCTKYFINTYFERNVLNILL